VDAGDEMPAMSVSGASGAPVEIDLGKGGVVAVEFWASWCKACRETLPALARLAEERRNDGFRAIAVNIDSSRAQADGYLADHLARYRDVLEVIYDPGGEAMARLGPSGLPALYIIEDGTVRLVQGGWKADGEQRLRKVVDTLLHRRSRLGSDPATESSQLECVGGVC
jgi:thiol-disulfide isomerase/thioredoxin